MKKLRYNRHTEALEPIQHRILPNQILGQGWHLWFFANYAGLNPYATYRNQNNPKCFCHTLAIRQNNPYAKPPRFGWLGRLADRAISPADRNNPWQAPPSTHNVQADHRDLPWWHSTR